MAKAIDSQDGSSRQAMDSWSSILFRRVLLLIIFLCFLLTRYTIFSSNLFLKLREIIHMSRTEDSSSILGKLFDSSWTFILPDLVMIPAFIFLSSLFTVMLVYMAEMALKEPKITWKNLTIEIYKKLKNGGWTAVLFVCFLPICYVSFSFSLIPAALLLRSLFLGFHLFASAVTLSCSVLVVYLDFFFFRRVLVSVAETGREGFTDFGNSEAENEEKKENTSSTKALFILAGIVGFLNTTAMYNLLVGEWGFMLAEFIFGVNGFLMLGFGLFLVTLFSHEWTSEPVEELVMQDKNIYNGVSSSSASREDIP